jgi:hypothetical protein
MKLTDFPLLKYSDIKLCVMTTPLFSFPQVFCWEAEVHFFICSGKNLLHHINHWLSSKAVLMKYRISYTKDVHTWYLIESVISYVLLPDGVECYMNF